MLGFGDRAGEREKQAEPARRGRVERHALRYLRGDLRDPFAASCGRRIACVEPRREFGDERVVVGDGERRFVERRRVGAGTRDEVAERADEFDGEAPSLGRTRVLRIVGRFQERMDDPERRRVARNPVQRSRSGNPVPSACSRCQRIRSAVAGGRPGISAAMRAP
ncbi:hypothetical protein WPS_23460 [Vulcanimicrobium alpinum]|uniref:Uncharacterized protein n=1 Tax=Vulcanimicrobium alpinum TaxID=3016050 RepID=A0AAN1XX80_UNVUL|nr:hypothetical protein WPS_23460 [Vulcanimicrobium alpinum]